MKTVLCWPTHVSRRQGNSWRILVPVAIVRFSKTQESLTSCMSKSARYPFPMVMQWAMADRATSVKTRHGFGILASAAR